MFPADQNVHIEEIPGWLFVPFAAGLAATITGVVRWVLRAPKA